MINDLIRYPLRGSGLYILIIGSMISILFEITAYIPILGIIFALISVGFFSAYFFEIVNSTASGKDVPCDFPLISDFWSDIFWPALCIYSALFFSFGPFLLFAFMEFPCFSMVFLILGYINLPMAILLVALTGRALTAYWPNTIRAILQCPIKYLLLLFVLLILSVIIYVVSVILLGIPVLGWFMAFFFDMYILMIQGRILGLFCRENVSSFN